MKISHTQIEDLACPKRFKFKRVLRLEERLSAYLLCGDSIHKGMEALNIGGDPIKGYSDFMALGKTKAGFTGCEWPNKARWDARESLKTWSEYAPKALRDYRSYWAGKMPKPMSDNDGNLCVEKLWEIDIRDGHGIWVKIDLITDDGVVVDYKTAGSANNVKDIEALHISQQTMIYAWAFWKKFGEPPAGARYDFFVLTKTPTYQRTPDFKIDMDEILRINDDIEQYIQEVNWRHAEDNWPRRRSECFNYGRACPFMAACMPERENLW